VPKLVRYVRTNGGDADALMKRFALDRDVESRDEVSISPIEFEAMAEMAARSLRDPFLAVHLVERLVWPSYSVPELAARASPTLREALGRVAKYAPLFYAPLVFELTERRGEITLTHRVRGEVAESLRHSTEYALASALHHARRITETRLTATRVWFAHARPRSTDELERFFGTMHLAFDRSDNGLAFRIEDAAVRLSTDDPRMLVTADAMAVRALEERPAANDLSALVRARLARDLEHTDVASVAKALRLSARTLQRRLADEGTSVKTLLDRVRRDRAEEWASGGSMPVAEMAFRLGYADAAAFSRAFKRWTGRSPATFRTEVKAQAEALPHPARRSVRGRPQPPAPSARRPAPRR
jgi:AraC-like DNA-binding protein